MYNFAKKKRVGAKPIPPPGPDAYVTWSYTEDKLILTRHWALNMGDFIA